MSTTLRHQASAGSGAAQSPTSSTSSQTTTPTSPHFLHTQAAVPRYASTHPYSSSYPREVRSTTSLSIHHPRPVTPPLLQPPGNAPFAAYLRSWGGTEISSFLGLYRCGQYAGVFQRNDIDGKVLLDLDMASLKEMGIAKVGERVKLLGGIKDLRRRVSAASIPPQRVEVRLNGSSSQNLDSDHPLSPGLAGPLPSIIAPSGSQGSIRRLNNTRPPPLDLQPHQTSRSLPQVVQNTTLSGPHGAQTLTPRPRLTQSTSSTTTVTSANTVPGPVRSIPTLRAPLSRDVVRRSPSPSNADAASFADRPLPPAPAQSSAAEYANSITQQRHVVGGRSTPVDPREERDSRDFRDVRDPRAAPTRPPQVNAIRGEHRKQTSLGSTPQKQISPIKAKFTQLVSGRPNTSGGAVHPFAAANSSRERVNEERTTTPTTLAGPSSNGSSHRRNPTGGYVVGTGGMLSAKTTSSDTRSRKEPSPQGQAQLPLEDIRRQVVKFTNVEDRTTRTVNVSSCSSGVEVLERVLKKFGKWNTGTNVGTDGESDDEGHRLEVDGWGVYAESDPDVDSKPLSEANLLGICLSHRDGSAIREKGLVLKRKTKPQYRKNMEVFFGETPPPPMSPTSPTYMAGPRLGYRAPTPGDDATMLSPSRPSRNKKMNRASTVSIMSGLGVAMPDAPPSPSTNRSPSSGTFLGIRRKPFYNFLGHRPPSELIANHLGEYFPAAKKRELEKSRNSMLRVTAGPKRLSIAASEKRGSFDTDRRSVVSPPRRKSVRPMSRATLSSPPSGVIPEEGEIETLEPVPRLSVSNDGGKDIRPRFDGDSDQESITSTASRPPLLPPFVPSQDSLADAIGKYSPTPKQRPKSILQARRGSVSSNKSRMSMLTQLRRNRDRSDTASMLTVDEITATVEQRRASTITFDESSDDERVDVPPAVDPGLVPHSETEEGSEADDEDFDSEDEESTDEDTSEDEDEDEEEEEEEEDEHGKAFTSTGSRIFKWIKGALIGAGSFGSVYLGMDAQSGLLMAVKQVELPTSAKTEERKKSMVDALEREIELLKELQHDNIVQYLDSSSDGNHLNIFLEYVPGGSVAALLNNYGAFEEALVRNFCRQILTGLNYLHEREIIHRDIKGANILVDNKGGIKISDFGISKKAENNLMTGMRANRPSLQGSVFWMAPEIVKQTSYTSKADIWSVGCLVVEMLTGTHPWAELTQMQAIFRIGSSAKPAIPGDISAEATDFLTRTFEIDHTARPTAAELLQHPFIAVKPGGGPSISAQQAKNAMAQATKTREAMMGGMQSLSALAAEAK